MQDTVRQDAHRDIAAPAPTTAPREAIDELVEAYALMANPLTIDGLAKARVRVLNAIGILRKMEAER